MSAVSIAVTIGATAVTTLGTAFFTYLFGVRRLHDEYELEQQRELRTLMGEYTGRMLEAAIDWDRRMTQLYDYWKDPDPKVPPPEGEDPEFRWYVMRPGHEELQKMEKKWPDRVIVKCPFWGRRLEAKRRAKAVARYRRHPREYFYLSVVFRFISLLAIARRFEAEAFYLDARHAKNNKNELYFLQYAKSFLWAVTHSGLSPNDGIPARDHFLSDKLRPMLDLCYKDLGPGADSRAPKGEPIFDWDRFLFLINKTGANKEYLPDLDRVLEFFDGLRPVDYIADKDKLVKRRRWERLICLHLLTLNFIETFGFQWQREEAEKSRITAIKFLSMDNTVIKAFLDGAEEWLGLEDQEHMQSLRAALESRVRKTQAIPDDEVIGRAAARLIGMGAQLINMTAQNKELDLAVMRENEKEEGLQFTVDKDWLKNVRWRVG